jgi:hypothetical protein
VEVAVEHGEVQRALSGKLLSETTLAMLHAVFGLHSELGEVAVVAGAAMREAVEQRALQAGPASCGVVEVM